MGNRRQLTGTLAHSGNRDKRPRDRSCARRPHMRVVLCQCDARCSPPRMPFGVLVRVATRVAGFSRSAVRVRTYAIMHVYAEHERLAFANPLAERAVEKLLAADHCHSRDLRQRCAGSNVGSIGHFVSSPARRRARSAGRRGGVVTDRKPPLALRSAPMRFARSR